MAEIAPRVLLKAFGIAGGFFAYPAVARRLCFVNRPAVIQAAYMAVLAVGDKPSVRKVCAMICRIADRGFRQDEVRAWLIQNAAEASVGTQTGHARDTPFTSKNTVLGHSRDTLGTRSKAQVLPFDLDVETRAREILALLWPIVALAVGRSMTQTAWKARNKTDAMNLARVGRSDADLMEAHKRASLRLGSCVYSLRIIVDELVRMDNPARPLPRPNKRIFNTYPVTVPREDDELHG